jgi:hypothetical protein
MAVDSEKVQEDYEQAARELTYTQRDQGDLI